MVKPGAEPPGNDNNPDEGTFLVLGILHEAVASFSRQRSLPDLWASVCRNARWIIPCQRMVVLLAGGKRECVSVARIESGLMLDNFATGFDMDLGITGRLLANRGVQWFTDVDPQLAGTDDLHRWLLEDEPGAIVSVPIKLEQRAVGALVFVLKNFDPSDQPLLNALTIGYSIYVGMAYSLINTMSELQAVRQEQDLLLVEIEAQNVELEQRNADIESKNTELEKQNAELERFAYTVSHDLKAPLVTISGFLGLLRKDIDSGDAEAIDADLRRIGGATEKMSQLLNELLELSRIGRLMNPPERVNLADLAREVVNDAGIQLEQGGIEIVVYENMPLVEGDPLRLYEVFQNLVDNAIKFIGDQRSPRIEIEARAEEGEVHCTVRDNGIGIAAQFHQRIFDLFDRLDQKIDGTGIGLALVKRIVEVHGGRIWVESAGEGRGSEFHFTLPAADPAAPAG